MLDYSSLGRVQISTLPTTVTSQIPKDWRMPLYLAASLILFVFLQPPSGFPKNMHVFFKSYLEMKALFSCSLQIEQKTKPF